MWFANENGRNIEAVSSLDQAWNVWKADCSPSLQPCLFADPVSFHRDKLISYMEGDATKPLIIAADSQEEALAFLSAFFVQDDIKLSNYRDRLIIFHKVHVLSEMAKRHSGFIPVILSQEVERELAGARIKGPSILVYPRNQVSDCNNYIKLDPLNNDAFKTALKEMGLSDEESVQLGRETGRSLTVLRRRLSSVPVIKKPAWASKSQRAIGLIPFIFAGAWEANNKADRTFLEYLAGDTPYKELQDRLTHILQLDDTPIWTVGSSYGVISRLDAFYAVQSVVTNNDLEIFFTVAEIVLSEEDPALSLSEELRWAAALYGKTREFSGILRKSLLDTLILISLYGRDWFVLCDNYLVGYYTHHLVYKCLTPFTEITLKSQIDNLAAYAEAAPETFLSIIEKDIQSDISESIKLMRVPYNGMFDRASRVGLLQALEILAWFPEFFTRTVCVLAHLAEKEPDDNLYNKPSESLAGIFCSWLPQTFADLEARKEVLALLSKRFPSVSWFLCVRELPSDVDKIGSMNCRPRWRKEGRSFYSSVSTNEANSFIRYVVHLVLNWDTYNIEILTVLINKNHLFIESDQKRVWDIIFKWSSNASDRDKSILCETMRLKGIIDRPLDAPNTTISEKLAEHIGKVYEQLKPMDPVWRHAWLFTEAWIRLPLDVLCHGDQDWRAHEKYIDKLRQDAVRDVLKAGGTEALIELASTGRAAVYVGWTLARIMGRDSELIAMLASIANKGDIIGARLEVLTGGLRAALINRGISLDDILTKVTEDKVLPLLREAPFNKATWETAKRYSKTIEQSYWRSVHPSFGEENLEFVANKLMNVERPCAAFNYVSLNLEKFSSDLIIRLLDSICFSTVEDVEQNKINQYHLREAFKVIYGRNDINHDYMLKIELFYINIFDRIDFRPINIEYNIEISPKLFVEALVYCFERSDNEADPELFRIENDDQRKVVAQRSYKLFRTIACVPGRRPDGSIDGEKLKQWIEDARNLTRSLARYEIGEQKIGEMFSHFPCDEQGVWPVKTVRDVMEVVMTDDMAEGIFLGFLNSQGVYSSDNKGSWDRKQASIYRNWADSMTYTHPRLASVLRAVERNYLQRAQKEKDEYQITQRLNG